MATKCTNIGIAIITNRITGAGTEPIYIGWGTGAGTAAVTSISCFTEVDVDVVTTTGTRTTGTSSRQTTTVANDTWRLTGTRTATGAGTITNAGWFDNSAIKSGTGTAGLGDFTGIGLAINDSIAFTINETFTP